jgi:hypothetical protein
MRCSFALMGFVGGVLACMFVWILLIMDGILPRYTVTCDNGKSTRYVYVANGDNPYNACDTQ